MFTRVLLALYGFLPWRSVPVMPIEIMLLPTWFPFHLDKISYWGRTVIVPLLVLMTLKPQARNPRGVRIDELFEAPPETIGPPGRAPHQNRGWFGFFTATDAMLRLAEPYMPKAPRQRAIDAAVAWVGERLNGEDGLGAIYPAMANSVMMYDALGYAEDHPQRAVARRSVDKLLVIHEHEAYCQPCVSPIWDTGLTCHALLETGDERAQARVRDGAGLAQAEAGARREGRLGGAPAERAARRLGVPICQPALSRRRRHRRGGDGDGPRARRQARAAISLPSIARAKEWIYGVQSKNGAWGAFDADNEYLLSQQHSIRRPRRAARSADRGRHRALCVDAGAVGRHLREGPGGQECASIISSARSLPDGSWYGRWGMNYIYGTWSVLCALNAAGVPSEAPEMRKAAAWLAHIQNPDGGWGEGGMSYRLDYRGYEPAPSTASQTAWALLGLMAAGEVDHPAVARGIDYLARTQGADGFWDEPHYTATGFPRVFYLRYHGYPKFFPLWALARYRNLRNRNDRTVAYGM